jgi:hypothetical protein
VPIVSFGYVGFGLSSDQNQNPRKEREDGHQRWWETEGDHSGESVQHEPESQQEHPDVPLKSSH